MPGKVRVKIISGKNLPVMDRSSDTTDAFVEIKLGNTSYKTDVCRKSLHPQWNSDWFKFELDDSELQDEPLQIRLMDYDTYSANDAIGKVYLNLNPLLSLTATPNYTMDPNAKAEGIGSNLLSGWIPVYDTMHGIRGEVNIIVKVELFSDYNKFRQSSCGVQFFCSPTVPQGYYAQLVHGFVEELIVNDDPEYQWIDKIRTPRASNEARQTLFFKLSGELQRKIGVKALGLGGNAVIGYSQRFDLEGESGIVARGIGTAVTLVKPLDSIGTFPPEERIEEQNASPLPEQLRLSPEQKTAPSPVRMHRRSSDSDLSITPKGNSLTGSDRSGGGNFSKSNMIRSQLRQENFDMLEYPFLTMNKFPLGLIVHLGGVVSARSVKLLERITNVEEPESRDIWWTEIRMEIRSHARSLNCNAVLGYTESTSICDDICILSASGTAAVVGFSYPEEMEDNLMGLKIGKDSSSTHNLDKDKDKNSGVKCPDSPEHFTVGTNCSITHLPYGEGSAPKRGHIMRCSSCCKGLVPEILIATIEPPENIPYTGRGCFIESFVCRPLKDLKGESTAKEISDGLPFLEYELHRHLVNKLKIKGMNAIFGLKVRISVGEKMLIGIAIGTALFLSSLPNPVVPQVRSDRLSDRKLLNLQKNLADAVRKNRTIYQLKEVQESENGVTGESSSDDEEIFQMDLSSGNKDCCILEVEDEQDEELLNFLIEQRPPDGFHVVSTETVPGLEDMEIVEDLQLFKQIYRAKLLPSYNLNYHFNRLLQSVYFKLRRMVPCALCDLQFRVDVPEGDEIQLCVLGTALGLKAQSKASRKHDEELIFKLEDYVGEEAEKNKSRSPSKSRSSVRKYVPEQERHGVDITPLTYVPGAKIERYLGYMNFFFIRETTSIREEGGLSGFIHSFVTEVLAIVRAHITALGGNAMVAYFLSECVLNHNLHKNQGQCLINVGGDIVFVSYFKEEL